MRDDQVLDKLRSFGQNQDRILLTRRQLLRRSALLAAGAVALGVAGCGTSSAPAPSQAPASSAPPSSTAASPAPSSASPSAAAKSLGTVRIAVLPYLAGWPLFVAIKKGFWQQVGVNVTVQDLNAGTTMLSAMVGGSLEVSPVVNMVSALQAIEQGMDLQFISNLDTESKLTPNHNYMAIMVAPNSPIKTAKDLEGKRVADNSLKGLNQLLLDRWMKMNGADPTKKQQVAMPPASMASALKAGQVDAIVTADPQTTQYEQNGTAKVLSYYAVEVLPSFGLAAQLATKAWADKNSQLLTAYLHGYNRAVDFIHANERGEALQIAADWTKTPLDIVQKMRLQEFHKGFDVQSAQKIADMMVEDGYISKKLDVSKYVSPLVTRET